MIIIDDIQQHNIDISGDEKFDIYTNPSETQNVNVSEAKVFEIDIFSGDEGDLSIDKNTEKEIEIEINTDGEIDLDISDEKEIDVEPSQGGGSNNYRTLSNKPSINGVVLIDNKTSAELGLRDKRDLIDYEEEVVKKPQINDITLIGNKTANQLNLQEKMNSLTNLEIDDLIKF